MVFEGNDKETFEGSETVHLLGVVPTDTDNVSKHTAIWGFSGFYSIWVKRSIKLMRHRLARQTQSGLFYIYQKVFFYAPVLKMTNLYVDVIYTCYVNDF